MAQTPAPQAVPPQPDQNPQIVQSGGGGTSWSKIIVTVLVIITVTAVISGIYWFFILPGKTDVSDLTGPVPKVDIPVATESATASATQSATTSAQ